MEWDYFPWFLSVSLLSQESWNWVKWGFFWGRELVIYLFQIHGAGNLVTTLLFWECRSSSRIDSQIIWIFEKWSTEILTGKALYFDKSGTREARAAALWVRNEVRPGSVLWKWFQLHFSVTSSHTDLFPPLLNIGDFQSNHPGDPPWSLSAEILWQNQDQVKADYFWIYFIRPDFVLPTALSTKVL